MNSVDSENDDAFWMLKALEQAKLADELNEVPVGAVIVRDGMIIGAGFNQPISSHDPCAHAEVMALRDAGANEQNYRLPDATLYVTIEPCSMCLGAMIHGRISRVVFGACEPKAGMLASNDLMIKSGIYNHQLVWEGGVLEYECSELIQAFFKRRRLEKKQAKRENSSL